MCARKLAYLAVGVSIMVCLVSVGLANALETKYYNKVPYRALFQTQTQHVNVQKTDNGKIVQAVIPVEKTDKTQKEKGE